MMKRLAGILPLCLLAIGCGADSRPAGHFHRAPEAAAAEAPIRINPKVRPPAMAGNFYPADKAVLQKTVDQYLEIAEKVPLARLRGLVCPHAGYQFSGMTAGCSYKQVQGRSFSTVVILGPSHYADFDGVALPDYGATETPLGKITVSPLAQKLEGHPPFVVNPVCRQIQRMPWSTPLAAGESPTPHTWEHSVEVQFPFVQRVLPEAQIMPGICGTVDTQQAAQVLAELIDDQTLVVASSDLSHYHPYDQAHLLDTICANCICQLDTVGMQQQEACGKTPILVLMHLAKLKHWKAKLLDLCNSGDRTGDKQRVVGYAAIAFYEEEPATLPAAPAAESEFLPNQKQLLLRLARASITRAVRGEDPPQAGATEITHPLGEPRACFVTLREAGQLRGCIGSLFPQEPLHLAVIHRAAAAALHDPRFMAVQAGELPKIEIEISVLTLPQPLKFSSPEDLLDKLRPRIDGVVLRLDGREATFLPQVWEELPGKVEFLDHLAQKAGRPPGAWRNPGTEVLVYQVVAFQEKGGG